MTTALLKLQGTILCYVAIGLFLKKTKLIDKQGTTFLTNFVINFLFPVNCFYSCLSSFSKDSFFIYLLVFIFSFLSEFFIFFISKKRLPLFNAQQHNVFRYGLLVSNGAFIGTPVVEGLFGSVGVMIANIFLIPNRIMAFSIGETIFKSEKKKTKKEIIKSILTNKIIIGVVLGMSLAFLEINIPDFINDSIKNISKCLSPISLILVGSILGENFEFNIKEDIKILILCFFRQIVIPLVTLAVLYFSSFDPIDIAIMVILSGMPCASNTAIFARKYESDTNFASKSVLLSTLTSTFTLLLISSILDKLLF